MKIKRKTARKKASFTLLELFICLMIIGIAGGALLWRVKGLLGKHRLSDTASHLIVKMRELQSLALSYQTDMEMEIFKDEKGIAYRMFTDEPLKFIRKGEAVPLKDGLDFIFDEKKNTSFRVTFYSNGWIEPRGTIEIQGKEGQAWVDFRTPLQIKFLDKKPNPAKEYYPERPNV